MGRSRDAWRLSCGSLAAALACLAACLPARAEGTLVTGPAQASARARLDFRIEIPAVVRVLSSGQPAQVLVSAEDVARGYVDVDRVRVHVVSNLRGIPRLVATVTAAFAERVQVAGLPEDLVASPEASTRLPARNGVVDQGFEVRFRIHLAPGAGPGAYPWPVRLDLAAV